LPYRLKQFPMHGHTLVQTLAEQRHMGLHSPQLQSRSPLVSLSPCLSTACEPAAFIGARGRSQSPSQHMRSALVSTRAGFQKETISSETAVSISARVRSQSPNQAMKSPAVGPRVALHGSHHGQHAKFEPSAMNLAHVCSHSPSQHTGSSSAKCRQLQSSLQHTGSPLASPCDERQGWRWPRLPAPPPACKQTQPPSRHLSPPASPRVGQRLYTISGLPVLASACKRLQPPSQTVAAPVANVHFVKQGLHTMSGVPAWASTCPRSMFPEQHQRQAPLISTLSPRLPDPTLPQSPSSLPQSPSSLCSLLCDTERDLQSWQDLEESGLRSTPAASWKRLGNARAPGSRDDNCLTQSPAPLISLPRGSELRSAADNGSAAEAEAVCHATELATLRVGIASLRDRTSQFSPRCRWRWGCCSGAMLFLSRRRSSNNG